MKIVIDIPNNIYDAIKSAQTIISGQRSGKTLLQILVSSVENGTPLPKGHGRKFEKIVVEYPPAELCTYPEYKGKPYFSIKYEENGKHIIGFGTYKPEVLSEYLREYFIAQTNIENVGMCQQNVGEMSEKQTDGDLISRDFMKKLGATCIAKRSETGELVAISNIDNLPSAEKTAEWKPLDKEKAQYYMFGYVCSKCGAPANSPTKYCSNCGANMHGGNSG